MARRKVGAIVNGRYVSYDDESNESNIAEICKHRSPPGLKGTDGQNFKGIGTSDPFARTRPNDAVRLRAEAKRLGISLEGKKYMASLVRPEYRGRLDPEALVDSVGDVKRVLERRGWGTDDDCDSMVKVKAREVEADDPLTEKYAPDPKLVHEHVQNDLMREGVDRIDKKEYASLVEKKTEILSGEQ